MRKPSTPRAGFALENLLITGAVVLALLFAAWMRFGDVVVEGAEQALMPTESDRILVVSPTANLRGGGLAADSSVVVVQASTSIP